MREEWKDIEGYEGLYQISNLGRVKSLMFRNNKYSFNKIYFMKPQNNAKGYKTIRLSKDGVVENHRIHRLVAKHYIPNLNNKPCVNHIDGNKQNNNVSNLEWATHSENLKHAHRTGLKKATFLGCYGKDNPSSKPIKMIDLKTGAVIKKFNSINEGANYINKECSAIAKCCKGKLKTAYGYLWKYVKEI